MSAAVVIGRWKRRWRPMLWRVEYHFVLDGETAGHAACGIFVGTKPAPGASGPWTRLPGGFHAGEPCPSCVKAVEATR